MVWTNVLINTGIDPANYYMFTKIEDVMYLFVPRFIMDALSTIPYILFVPLVISGDQSPAGE